MHCHALSPIKKPDLQRAFVCALAVWACLSLPAHALPNSEQLALYEQAPEQDRVMTLMMLARSGRHEEASFLLERYPLTGPHAQNRTIFIQGLILKAQGDLTGAAKLFRAALAADPSLTLVRAELAQTLVTLDEDDSAKHHLERLAAEAPDAEAAKGVRSFIDQVDAKRPYKFGAYVSFVPTTNLNSGSKHETVYFPLFDTVAHINPASQQKSGIGVAAGVNGAFTKRLGNDFSFVAAGGADVRVYDDSAFNSYGLSQSLEIRHLLQQGHIGLGVVSSQTFDNQDFSPSYISYGPRVSASLQATQRDHLSISATFEWRDVLGSSAEDTTAFTSDLAWTHSFDQSLAVTLFGGLDVINHQLRRKAYETVNAGVAVYKELPLGITANVTGQVSATEFKGFDFIIGDFREDLKLKGSVELTKRDFNILGFAPALSYTFTENFSNTNMFDYRTHAVDFRLKKEF